MSFSQDIKDEILENISNDKKNLLEAERFGEYLTQTESKEEIIDIKNKYKKYINVSNLSDEDIKYILKGVYLSAGCIVDPNLDYHFEIIIKNIVCKNYLMKILEVLDFTPKCIKRKSSSSYSYVIYIKDSDQISTFLSLIGTSESMLKFEQIRVEKEVKNNINRNVNCEAANIAKTISTSMRQIEAINTLKSTGNFLKLDDKLKYVANLRIKYQDASYDKLSKITVTDKANELSKSGIKHRLDKLVSIASDIDSNKKSN